MLRARATRVTRARVIILAMLLESSAALSHQEILQRLSESGATIDRVTVYRTLDWLAGAHLAHRVSTESRSWHFGAIVSDHDRAHAHFECRSCERVYCIESAVPPKAEGLPRGFKVEQTTLRFEGQCADCARTV